MSLVYFACDSCTEARRTLQSSVTCERNSLLDLTIFGLSSRTSRCRKAKAISWLLTECGVCQTVIADAVLSSVWESRAHAPQAPYAPTLIRALHLKPKPVCNRSYDLASYKVIA